MKKIIIFGVDGLTMPLLRRFCDEGILPAIKKMFDAGAATELLPFISAWGDVNWVTFMSGQCPGKSWIGQGMPPDNMSSNNLLALLEKAGLRAALMHFPETVSVGGTSHFEMAPYWGRPAPFELCPAAIHRTAQEDRVGRKKQQKLGWPAAAALAYHEKDNRRRMLPIADGYLMEIAKGITAKVSVLNKLGKREFSVEINKHSTPLHPSVWSDWLMISDEMASAKVRFCLVQDSDDGEVEILQSQVMKPEALANDRSLGLALCEKIGPFIAKWTAKVSPDEPLSSSAIDEAEYQSLWLADCALELTKNHGFSLWATVHRLVDESHHNCLGLYDPESPFYDSGKAEKYGEVIRECYRVLDRTIGRIMDKMDDETILMLASDHGAVPNSYMCDINRYLAEVGLVTLSDEGRVIREKSRVFLKDERGGLEIFVNLAGREVGGIVAPEDYDSVCEEVQHALGRMHVVKNGKVLNAISMALKKSDAVGIGYWGQYAGDVIFAYNTGFVWGVSAKGETICPVESPGANHGPQKPTARTETASNYGVFLTYGHGIRKGYLRDIDRDGPYRMVDPAATIAHLFGVKSRTLDGVVMHDFMEDRAP